MNTIDIIDEHKYNDKYCTNKLEKDLKNVIYILEDDKIDYDLKVSNNRYRNNKFARTNVLHRFSHEINKHNKMN